MRYVKDESGLSLQDKVVAVKRQFAEVSRDGLHMQQALCEIACARPGMARDGPWLDEEEYELGSWAEQVPSIASRFGLPDSVAKVLARAAEEDSVSESAVSHEPAGNGSAWVTTYTRFSTLRDGDRIHLIVGRFEQLCARESGTAAGHTVQLGNRSFKAVPEADPDGDVPQTDMEGRVLEIPPCARPVSIDDQEFGRIMSDVIQPHGWSSDTLLLFNAPAGEWRTYHTKNLEPPGQLRNSRVRWFHPEGSKFKLIPSIRMLVEVHRRILDEEEEELKQRLGQFAEGYARRWWAKEVGGLDGLEGREASPHALEL